MLIKVSAVFSEDGSVNLIAVQETGTISENAFFKVANTNDINYFYTEKHLKMLDHKPQIMPG